MTLMIHEGKGLCLPYPFILIHFLEIEQMKTRCQRSSKTPLFAVLKIINTKIHENYWRKSYKFSVIMC